MQIKKYITGIFTFTIILLVFFISNAFASSLYENPNLKLRVENFIIKSDRYKIFSMHMKVNKILEKLDVYDFEKTKYKQLGFIDEILRKSIQNYIELNSKNKLEQKLKEVIKNKGEIIKDLDITKIDLIDNKSYTPIRRVFYKAKVEYINNGNSQIEFLNIYYNGDIGVYYRPQENNVNANYISKNLSINLNNKRISGTLSYNSSKTSQNLIILTTGGGENDRDFISSKHRINVVLSNYLNSIGYTVFSYDKSSVGQSTGDNYMNLTSEDLANDLDGVVKHFKTQSQLSIDKIGLLGQSEGAVISTIVASKNSDISFLILLSAPYSNLENMINDGSVNLGLGKVSMTINNKVKGELSDIIDIIKKSGNKEQTSTLLAYYKDSLTFEDKLIFKTVENNLPFASQDDLSSAWLKHYLTLDINNYLKKINIPILVINGNKDFIIDDKKMGDIKNLIKANNPLSDIIILENTGHMMEYNTTRTDDDYSSKSETVNQNGLDGIGDWIGKF